MLPLLALVIAQSTLTVGDDRGYARIEDAVRAAQPGSTIEVYASQNGYPKTALVIDKPNLHIRGMGKIELSGKGFDYSGVGQIPRAIIQVNPGGEGTTIENLEFDGAHNDSHNGSGIRINAANRVKIVNCDIHGNDMGIMSSGHDGDPHAGEDQRIENCKIHENGDPTEPGYNHNLYLGGTSVTLENCDIYGAVTGHNLKSRAHFIVVRNCHIHGGDNRQIDLVEAWDTERPDSNALVIGCQIEMSPEAHGNRNVIHFGQEKGRRNGKLYLVNDKVTSPFISPVVLLDSPTTSAEVYYSTFTTDPGTPHELVVTANGAKLSDVRGHGNQFSPQFRLTGVNFDTAANGSPVYFRDGAGISHVAK